MNDPRPTGSEPETAAEGPRHGVTGVELHVADVGANIAF